MWIGAGVFPAEGYGASQFRSEPFIEERSKRPGYLRGRARMEQESPISTLLKIYLECRPAVFADVIIDDPHVKTPFRLQ